MNRYITVSGLPASGKSTLARVLAKELVLPLLDKDDFLESMFEGRTVGDLDTRGKLSRAADRELRNRAEQSNGAIITSWWKHPRSPADSGTPTEWLTSLPGLVVEVYCECSPVIAARRFVGRQRHPGHLDCRWSYPELLADFTEHASRGPLGVGRLVIAPTDREIEFNALTRAIEQAWEIQESPNQASAHTP
jgi:gluconate kinase